MKLHGVKFIGCATAQLQIPNSQFQVLLNHGDRADMKLHGVKFIGCATAQLQIPNSQFQVLLNHSDN
jgi:hypothetical protein